MADYKDVTCTLLGQDLATTARSLTYAGEWRHRRQDGSIFLVEITSHQLIDEERVAWLVVAYDVSERKEAADTLVASLRTNHLVMPFGRLRMALNRRSSGQLYN
jgi:hypothetical protein